ncbi:MAG: hypothetical protein VKK80_12025 [Prochlorothrix sp.]|nr:hypothetical protein [Prochlorothrix sp.]
MSEATDPTLPSKQSTILPKLFNRTLRIALVAEGPGDLEVIQAALKAILPNPFVLTLLQPEATQPRLGTGWGGVAKWCHETQKRHQGSLDFDPTLACFDLLIIHVDVDVGGFEYQDYDPKDEPYFSKMAQDNAWKCLPCQQPCPPVSATVTSLLEVIRSWLGQAIPGNQTCFCLPAQSSGTWLATAVLPPSHPCLQGGECDPKVEKRLAQLPKQQRIKKSVRNYRVYAPKVTENWQNLKQCCSQAQAFETEILTILQTDPHLESS